MRPLQRSKSGGHWRLVKCVGDERLVLLHLDGAVPGHTRHAGAPDQHVEDHGPVVGSAAGGAGRRLHGAVLEGDVGAIRGRDALCATYLASSSRFATAFS